MSGTSDKARFYMEQAVPQLQELEQKKIFTPIEIKNLVKKRSDFEHKVLQRGSTANDYIKYLTWDISLETLRAKRVKRMKIKNSTTHAGQARIFSIFDRATKKHPGDLSLWMFYLQYCRSIKSTKKHRMVLTNTLRLHCTKAELWLYAAKYSLEEESDFGAARSYMQKGQRFCTSQDMWIEYARLEMICLPTIIEWRQKILGMTEDVMDVAHDGENVDIFADNDANMIALPAATVSTLRTNFRNEQNNDAQTTLPPALNKALNGAIPLLIFDDAQKQPFYNAATAEAFFEMFAAFKNVHCQAKMLQYVLDAMTQRFPHEASTASCFIRLPIIGVDPRLLEFATALEDVLERLRISTASTKDRPLLANKVAAWMTPLSRLEDLDQGVKTVLIYTLKKL